MKADTKTILIIRQDAVGDIVLTIPMAVALKQHYPKSTITMMVKEPFLPLLNGIDAIDRPVAIPDSLDDWLADNVIDMVILPNLTWELAMATWKARIHVRVGDDNRIGPNFLMTHTASIPVSDSFKHVIEHNMALLTAIGIDDPQFSLELDIPRSHSQKIKSRLQEQGWDKEKLVVIQPCTGGSDRQWHETGYIAVVNQLQKDKKVSVVLCGAGPEEEAVIDRISKASDRPPLTLCGYGTFPELKGLLKLASVVVGTNTGPLHMAAAIGTPSVMLFPSKFIKPFQWAPWDAPHKVIRNVSDCPLICIQRSCQQTFCLDHILANDITLAIKELMTTKRAKKQPPKALSTYHPPRQMWLKDCATILFEIKDISEIDLLKVQINSMHSQANRVVLASRNKRLLQVLSQYIPEAVIKRHWRYPFDAIKTMMIDDVMIIHPSAYSSVFLWKCLSIIAASKLSARPKIHLLIGKISLSEYLEDIFPKTHI